MTDKGVPYTLYHRVSKKMSLLVQKGEQEHLDDAKRAYDLSYGLITRAIRAMKGQTFGPARTPQAAEDMALESLDKRLPAALSVKQTGFRGAWVKMLDTLLSQTKVRDTNLWHSVQHGKRIRDQKKRRFIYPLEPSPKTNIGVDSDQVVNYPKAP